MKNAEELASGEYNMTNLQSCTVQLQGPLSSLHLRNMVDCTVDAGPVSGPIFVHGELRLFAIMHIHHSYSCSQLVACIAW